MKARQPTFLKKSSAVIKHIFLNKGTLKVDIYRQPKDIMVHAALHAHPLMS